MFVNIHVFSKNYISLKAFLNFFFKVCNTERMKTYFVLIQHSKPKVIKKFTVLKSPHVNKKAQEQFEFCLHKNQLSIYSYQNLKLLTILKKIQTTLFADIKIKVQFVFNYKKFQKEKKEKLNPNKVFSKKISENKSKTHVYLKLLDIYGENHFKNYRVKL